MKKDSNLGVCMKKIEIGSVLYKTLLKLALQGNGTIRTKILSSRPKWDISELQI